MAVRMTIVKNKTRTMTRTVRRGQNLLISILTYLDKKLPEGAFAFAMRHFSGSSPKFVKGTDAFDKYLDVDCALCAHRRLGLSKNVQLKYAMQHVNGSEMRNSIKGSTD